MATGTSLIDSYQKADALLSKGELQQAADICKQMLDSNPNFAYGYHLMASLFKVTGNFEKALNFAELAIKLDPNVPSFYLQRGALLMSLQCYEAAEDMFRKAYQMKPDLVQALLMSADACVHQGRYEDAARFFAIARSRAANDEQADIDQQEGICQLAQGHIQRAEALFDRVIAQRPSQADGYLHKGRILLHQHRDQEAEVCYARALNCNPHLQEALHGMAVVNERQGQLDTAVAFAIQAVSAHGTVLDSLLLLGQLLLRKQNWSSAEQIFRQALAVVPEQLLALHGLAKSLLAQRRQAELRVFLDEQQATFPDNAMIQFLATALSGRSPARPPQQLVASYYDELARRYNYFLQPHEMYQPQHAVEILRALPQLQGRTGLSLADLGCGDGRFSAALGDLVESRLGVDLSRAMLDLAQVHRRYYETYTLDMVEFAMGSDRMFDVVAAFGVLAHLGDLEPFFRAARNLLASSSVMLFTIEKSTSSDPYTLRPNGRYAHQPAFIHTLLQDHGYNCIHSEEVLLRLEAGVPVMGMVYVVQKMTVH
jgi:predicted TPR repeat methyltransferase